jgi:hypothetical protein
MPNPPLTDYLTAVGGHIQDQANKLSTDDRLQAVQNAVAEHGRFRPAIKRRSVPGSGTATIGTPTGFVEDFSTILRLEYPVGGVPPTYLAQTDWRFVSSPTALTTYQIQFLTANPGTAQRINVEWTAPHRVTDAEATIPEIHFRPVAALAGSYACLALAGYYAQSGDPLISIDSQNPMTKSAEYRALARELRSSYNRFFGINEKDASAVPAGAVIAPMERTYQWGGEFFGHPRWWRRR